MKLGTVKDSVEILLRSFPEFRDDDNALIANLIFNKVGPEKILEMTALDLLKLMELGKLPSPESIRRVRQKLQEIDVSLRGKNYVERHKHQEDVKTEIKKFTL